MSDYPEAFGDIVQGAMIARAVEPGAGEAPGHGDGAICLNCGTAPIGNYCHHCGQSAHVHRTLSAFFHDLLHGVAHFEGKIWHTVPQLAWHPGRLTREYIDGKRASHVSPVALFLFVVFLTFAVFHAVGDEPRVNTKGAGVASAQLTAQIAGLEGQRSQAVAKGKDTADIDEELSGLRTAQTAIRTGSGLSGAAAWHLSSNKGRLQAIDHAIEVAKENPDLALFKLEYSAYKYSWLLIPLSVPFVWLMFPFDRRFKLYDHTVFVTYSLSFMYLLLAAVTLCAELRWESLSELLVLALLVYAPFHMYRQLRGTYALSPPAAAIRAGFLLVCAASVLVVWAMALLVMVTAG